MDADFYPRQQRLIQKAGIEKEDALLVDTDGRFRHDLADFRHKWLVVTGRLVLQDLYEVVCSAKGLDLSIEVMAHNFFQPQPINGMLNTATQATRASLWVVIMESNTISPGTRAYYMHSTLYDWLDNLCHKVLDNVVSAMEPGYSKRLLKENVMQETGAYWETTKLDLVMMQIGQMSAQRVSGMA